MEIDEREQRPFLSPPRKKHRSPSPDGGTAESEPKRRKHHHRHRHHRHRHRHHSKKDREKDEGGQNKERLLDDEMADGVADENRMVEDGELEEGEILEDGEIKPEPDTLVFSGEDRTYSDKELNALDCDSDALQSENAHDLMNHKSLVVHSEIPSQKIEAVPRFDGANLTKGKSSVMVGESEFSKNSGSERKESIDKDDDAGTGDFRNRARSVSPYSRGNVYAMKYKDREEDNEITSNHSLGRHRNSEDMINSPSCKWHQSEVCHRDQSRSHDTGYDRSDGGDQRGRHKVRSRPSDAEMDNGCMERERSICQYKRDGLEDRYGDNDRRKDMDRGVRKERERSASYSRYDRRESRYSDRDRGRDITKEHRRERDRSSSVSSKHDRDRERRQRDRGSVRDRDMEKPRDVSRERYRERVGLRDVGGESERGRYGYDREKGRIRDRELNLDTDREPGRQFERDRVNSKDKQRDSRYSKYDEQGQHRDRMRSKELGKESASARHDFQGKRGEPLRDEDEEDYEERIEQQLAKQEEEDPDKIKEESRKRRQAILEKYKQQQQKHVEAPSDNFPEEDKESMQDRLWEPDTKKSVGESLMEGSDVKQDSSDSYVADPSFTVAKSPILNGTVSPERNGGAGGLGEGTPESDRSMDMFCDDIFGESPVGTRKKGKGGRPKIERSSLHDNWDDADGYYSYRFGEVLDGRYEVIAGHGKGVFSTVVRAKDLKAGRGEPREVAIKIIRNNHQTLKAGHDELKTLGILAAEGRGDRRHCVRFLSSFKYRSHLCLVFESLHMNLREVLKKFGRNIGLALTAVRTYAKQLFVALKHLRDCGVLHCDIKPDNMLVNEGKNVLKLCDFGNAMLSGNQEPTPYLVSRFYRSPEIILGLDYDYPLDMWSVGCCLYELYAGKVLFPGKSNNEMLRLHMELKGPFPKKMLRKGLFTGEHFDQDLNFHATEEDPVTGKVVKRLLLNIKPKDISTLISGSPGEDPKMVASFKDILERIFILDPEKRLTVSQALSHPFITGK